MNIVNQGGRKIIQYSDRIVIDGITVEYPEYVKDSKKSSLITRGSIIVVNGYKLNLTTMTFEPKRERKFLGIFKT